MASTKEEEEVSSKAEVEEEEKEKDEAFQATKERAKGKETSWLESATTVESRKSSVYGRNIPLQQVRRLV